MRESARAPDTRDEVARWLCVVDARKARLLRAGRTAQGNLHLDPVEAVEDDWQEKEHGRPQGLTRKAGYTFAARSHEEEERRRRFAGKIAAWLAEKLRGGVGRIEVLAPSALLGALRRTSGTDAEGLTLHEGDFGSHSPGELEHHARIIDLLRPDEAS